MRIYPEAKLVLTERDPYKWIKSVRETICPKKSLVGQYFFNRIMKTILCSNFPQMVTHAIQYSMGPNVDLNNDEQMIQGFIRWNQEVKQVVPADRLLVFNVKDGWEPLCTFLNKPIPDVRFPRFNERAHAKSRMKRYYKRALCRITAGELAIGVTVVLSLR
ncbi:hypothetical protein FGIG_09514 [Fasciola gigantica]|uniref:Uncharacterized protein n=1 Tax=Fasciola gigantica TaxID=46835 RepID=A0A504YY94_FASGI|nr:hypothetical protein FGIG_09514 [Fasciola gigantica]